MFKKFLLSYVEEKYYYVQSWELPPIVQWVHIAGIPLSTFQHAFRRLTKVTERHRVSEHQKQLGTSLHCTRTCTSGNWFSIAGTRTCHHAANASRTGRGNRLTALTCSVTRTQWSIRWHGSNSTTRWTGAPVTPCAVLRADRRLLNTNTPQPSLCYITTLWVKCTSWGVRVIAMKNPSGKYF